MFRSMSRIYPSLASPQLGISQGRLEKESDVFTASQIVILLVFFPRKSVR